MNIVYLLDPDTQVGYAIDQYEDRSDAMKRKDDLQVQFPANLFFYTANMLAPQRWYSLEEALLIVNGKDIYVQSGKDGDL